MLKLKVVAISCILMAGISCSDSKSAKSEVNTTKEVVKTNKSVSKKHKFNADIVKSVLLWQGHKIMGSHEGEMDLKSGYITEDKGGIIGGKFIVDMSSIRAKSLMDGGDDHDKSELAGHLKDGDFFDVNTYPTAQFVITNAVNKGSTVNITGNMTIKNVTQPISFSALWTNQILTAKVNIDRTKFNIKYGSGSFFDNLGDRAIKDEFSLDLKFQFK